MIKNNRISIFLRLLEKLFQEDYAATKKIKLSYRSFKKIRPSAILLPSVCNTSAILLGAHPSYILLPSVLGFHLIL